ncbi:MAG: cytochrome c oxidase subunit I [Planctomycetota bacterium]|nr:MAG: cytochrome c oxidase subunit I [Planctomycetota bacterium]
MTTISTSSEQGVAGEQPVENYLNCSHGFMSWAFSLDHKRIGVMYLVGIFTALFLGGVMALIVRAELWTPGPTIISHDQYNQMFTLHGAVMIFLVIIPSIPAALGNFVLPMQLGAKDVAFPRLNLMSFHFWVVGAVFFIAAMMSFGLDTGWTLYTPYSLESQTAVVLSGLGAFILGFSSIFTGINFIVTVHKMRPEGMGFFRMPLLLWALYSTAVIQVLATPIIGITLLLLAVERVVGIGIFNPELGGDPVLFQHFFWFYSHPAVYVMILPAMGVISELFSVFSRKPIFGYRFIAISSIAIAILGFLVWGHHMFTSGQSDLAGMIFSALTFSVAVPSAIKVFNWIATLYKGSIRLDTPMWYALAFIFLFTIGGLTGIFLGAMSNNIHLHDTYFVVAHFHYVMVGGAITAFFGGVHYWWPKMTGKMYDEKYGKITCLLVFVGFNMTFFPQFVMGSRGMPRRYYNYAEEYTLYHQLSTIGALILGLGIAWMVINLYRSLRTGKKAGSNPFGGTTLEWQTPSPAPHHNFDETPLVCDPYDMKSVKYDSQTEDYVRDLDYVRNCSESSHSH